MIVRGQDKRIGLTVDELVGQRELVTRPLPAIVSEGQPVSGGAVLADGQIALIVDCDALAAGLGGQPGKRPSTTESSGSGASELAVRADDPSTPLESLSKMQCPIPPNLGATSEPGASHDMQLDALRELANISSGTAATSLSQMLGREVDLNVPKAFALAAGRRRRCGGRSRARTSPASCCPSRVMSTASCCCWSSRAEPRRSATCSASSPAPRSATRRWVRSATSSVRRT